MCPNRARLYLEKNKHVVFDFHEIEYDELLSLSILALDRSFAVRDWFGKSVAEFLAFQDGKNSRQYTKQ